MTKLKITCIGTLIGAKASGLVAAILMFGKMHYLSGPLLLIDFMLLCTCIGLAMKVWKMELEDEE